MTAQRLLFHLKEHKLEYTATDALEYATLVIQPESQQLARVPPAHEVAAEGEAIMFACSHSESFSSPAALAITDFWQTIASASATSNGRKHQKAPRSHQRCLTLNTQQWSESAT